MLIEPCPSKPGVGGSNPSWLTKIVLREPYIGFFFTENLPVRLYNVKKYCIVDNIGNGIKADVSVTFSPRLWLRDWR